MTQAPGNSTRSFLMWVFAAVLVLGGLAFLLFSSGVIAYSGPIEPLIVGATGLLALPFAVRWLSVRDETWSLLVACLFAGFAVVLTVILLNPPAPQLVGITALGVIAVPFVALYLLDSKRWWALIPGYAALALAVLMALTIFNLSIEIIASIGLILLALPFWVAYMNNRTLTWAGLLAGLFSLVGVVMLIAFSFIALFRSGSNAFYIVTNSALALVFMGMWLTIRRFGWALWLSIGFGASAVVAVFVPGPAAWGTLALVMGIYIAYTQIDAANQGRQAAKAASAPTASAQPATPASAQPAPAPPAPPAQAPASPPASAPAPAPVKPASQPIKPTIPANEEAVPGGRPDQQAVTGFRPIDPLKGRKSDND